MKRLMMLGVMALGLTMGALHDTADAQVRFGISVGPSYGSSNYGYRSYRPSYRNYGYGRSSNRSYYRGRNYGGGYYYGMPSYRGGGYGGWRY